MTLRHDIEALQRCAIKAANAQDGRGLHGAFIECRNALVKSGATEALASACATAMTLVGHGIGARAKERGALAEAEAALAEVAAA